jgi:hypothetical protein
LEADYSQNDADRSRNSGSSNARYHCAGDTSQADRHHKRHDRSEGRSGQPEHDWNPGSPSSRSLRHDLQHAPAGLILLDATGTHER